MVYYGVVDLSAGSNDMYNTEILYPYIITKEEIVCTWEWPIIEEYISKQKGKRLGSRSSRNSLLDTKIALWLNGKRSI